MNPHYFRALDKIQKAIKDVNATDHTQTDRDGTVTFMKGYIHALAESDLINSDECLSLRDELSREFYGFSLRSSIEKSQQYLNGEVVSFIPVANFRNEVSFLMDFMQNLHGKKLTDEQYLRAKEIAIDDFQSVEVPTVRVLVNAWKTEPMLADFAASISRAALPGIHGKHFTNNQ